jgi:hypothetical protein
MDSPEPPSEVSSVRVAHSLSDERHAQVSCQKQSARLAHSARFDQLDDGLSCLAPDKASQVPRRSGESRSDLPERQGLLKPLIDDGRHARDIWTSCAIRYDMRKQARRLQQDEHEVVVGGILESNCLSRQFPLKGAEEC